MLTPTGVTAEQYWDAIKAGNPTHVRITFTEQEIVLGDQDIEYNTGITLTDVFNGDMDLVFGQTISKQITIGILNSERIADLVWTGEFKLEMGVEIGDPAVTYWQTVGYFSGERPNNVTATNVINFTAYDRMKMFEILADDFPKLVQFPATTQDIYDALCLFVGLQNDAGDELVNIMDRTYDEMPAEFEGYTCRDVLSWIAEANGCYAKINGAGHVQLVWFTDNSDHVISTNEEYDVESIDVYEGITWDDAEDLTWDEIDELPWEQVSGSMEEYKIDQISVLQLSSDMQVDYPNSFGQNKYMIVDNPFLAVGSDQERTEYIAPLFERVNQFSGYIPVTADCIGCWLVEAGDIVTIDVYGHSLPIPIFMKTMRWNGGTHDSYETTGNKKRPVYTNDKNKEKVLSANAIKMQVKGKYYDRMNGIVIDEDGVEITGDKSIVLDSQGSVLIHAGHEYDKWNFDAEGLVFEGHAVDGEDQPKADAVRFGISPLTGEQVPETECGIFPSYNRDADYADLFLKVWMKRYNAGIDKPEGAIVHMMAIDTDDDEYPDEGSQICIYPERTFSDAYSGCIGTRSNIWRHIYCETIHFAFDDHLSSRELKDNINPLKDYGSAIDKLKPVSFMYKTESKRKNGRTSYGLVYEDTVDVMPEICSSDHGVGTISYMSLIPILLTEVQNLRKRVAELEKRVKGDEK